MVLWNIMTVHAGPRTWSSYTNVNYNNNHQANRLSGMNSVQELNNYHRGQQYSAKTAATTYDFPENPNAGQNSARKEKKWSFGSLFRRKKRDASDSSSDGDSKNFLTRRRRKKSTEKKKRNLVSGNFDHIVPNPAQSGRYYSQSNGQDDVGVLSDPTGGFSPSYSSRPLPKLPPQPQQFDSLQTTNSSFSVGSSESSKRSRRDRLRLRSTRNNIDSSSDDSQSSARLKSDESLVRSRDGSTSRKSRSARTERYIRRLSKDEENILNREAALIAAARSSDKTGIATIAPINIHSNSQTSLETPILSTRQSNYLSNRSISYEANIHRSPINLPSKRIKNLSLGNPYIEAARYPPTPPPRDPKRIPQEPRPISTYYNTTTNYPQNSSHLNRLVWNQNNRSNSEDHIAIAEYNQQQPLQVPRPNSAQQQSNFQYLAEKKPRSRRPIIIQSNEKTNQVKNDEVKQIFTAQTHVRTNIFLPSCLNSDISSSPNCMMGVDTVDCSQPKEVYMPRQVKNNIYNNVNSDRSNSPFKPICSPNYAKDILLTSSVDSLADEIAPNGQRRKSTNLEEALDELEAIYKSLHLGDEDLLERAEQREMSAATKKLIDSKAESYPGFVYGNKENIFSYEPFDTIDAANKKRLNRRSQTIDRKYDDMAFRKMTRERSSTIADPSSVISYLLASPVHGSSPQELVQDEPRPTKEPDITLDDVVFRNIRHANGSLKVVEPQPPFGIPIGPISTAPNSDYLHAVPDETIPRYSVHRRRIPDIVKDDLAYRNLRKELNNKEPVFKSLVPEDVENNNADLNIIKKKRAVRSLSANITNLLQRDAERQQQQQEIDDVADAMEIARQILREKEQKINSINRAFMSDTDTKYRKDSVYESRLNFLNTMKSKYTDRMEDKHKTKKHLGDTFLESKPPKSTTPERRAVKESTPVPHSPSPMLTRQDSLHSSLEELLTAFAVEARETSDRITNELLKLDEDITKKLSSKDSLVPKKSYSENIVAKEDDFAIEGSPKSHKKCNVNNKVTFSEDTKDKPPVALPRKSPNKEPSPRCARRNIGNEKTRLIDEIDKVAIVTARIVNTPIKELIAYEKEIEADNLVDEQILIINAVADHAKQCEQLAEAIIDCAKLELIEESVPESVTVINQDLSQEEETSTSPDHDYVNISDTSDVDLPMIDEIIKDDRKAICKSPFEEHKAELIASFQELGKMIDDACLKTVEPISTSKEDIREISPNEGETEAEVGLENIQYKAEEQLNISYNGLVTSYKTNYTMFIPDYDSVEQTDNYVGELASLESLKSPKLVFSTLSLSNLALDEPEIDSGSQFTSLESEVHINNTEVDKIPNNVSNGLSVIQALKEANVSSTCQNRPLQFIDNLDLDESELLVNEMFDKKRSNAGFGEKFVDNLEVDDTIQEKQPLKIETLQKRGAANNNNNSSQSSTSKPCTDNKRSNFHHDENSTLKERPWYCDPMLLVIVCYYGLACSYQLATMDAVTILGLVFVIVSVIAAMIL